eukprot:9492947-Ditylum_brightwellii.AAC.1
MRNIDDYNEGEEVLGFKGFGRKLQQFNFKLFRGYRNQHDYKKFNSLQKIKNVTYKIDDVGIVLIGVQHLSELGKLGEYSDEYYADLIDNRNSNRQISLNSLVDSNIPPETDFHQISNKFSD